MRFMSAILHGAHIQSTFFHCLFIWTAQSFDPAPVVWYTWPFSKPFLQGVPELIQSPRIPSVCITQLSKRKILISFEDSATGTRKFTSPSTAKATIGIAFPVLKSTALASLPLPSDYPNTSGAHQSLSIDLQLSNITSRCCWLCLSCHLLSSTESLRELT